MSDCCTSFVPDSGGGGGGGGGGIAGITVEDEGVAVPGGPFTGVDLIGAGVEATDQGGGIAAIAIPGNVSALPEQWVGEAIIAGTPNTPLSAQVSTNFDDIRMIRPGSLVGFCARLSQPLVAGTITIGILVNGVGVAEFTVNVGTPNGTTVGVGVGVLPYAANDLIGARYRTSGAFNAGILPAVEVWIQVFEKMV